MLPFLILLIKSFLVPGHLRRYIFSFLSLSSRGDTERRLAEFFELGHANCCSSYWSTEGMTSQLHLQVNLELKPSIFYNDIYRRRFEMHTKQIPVTNEQNVRTTYKHTAFASTFIFTMIIDYYVEACATSRLCCIRICNETYDDKNNSQTTKTVCPAAIFSYTSWRMLCCDPG